MAMKFQYNKSVIQQFRRQLSIREKALPILKNKETALRQEEKEAARALEKLVNERAQLTQTLESFQPFWSEFPPVIQLEDTGVYQKKVVGVTVPDVNEPTFRLADISWWHYPAWVPAGIHIMQQVIAMDIKIEAKATQRRLLNIARKKTTQKVNLYEKVQIPAYEEAIRKIKRFLEDKENIAKAAQKIVKKKKDRRAAT
ncbi:V-type ATP synthase subunit D [Tunicatimonas pelagia]|uniref:V-type ATP synthase subunit D n=1 Tax=Tunicatimonas pelagia TaxID=931531 RepID=UPI0026651A0E|nr:V-type ATP synthase subunit D [Tunicatimonas pelagia]WKN45597.1 V-type ATP synthase subunit D [Tunicatimonas pelagia]